MEGPSSIIPPGARDHVERHAGELPAAPVVQPVGARNSAVLRGLRVLGEQPAEAVSSADPEVLAGVPAGKRPQWCGSAEGAVRTVLVEVPFVFG